MSNFADRLAEAIDRKASCVVVGLDPRVDALPPDLLARARQSKDDAADAVLEFNRQVIAAVAPHAVAVKPQAAFYEALGQPGFRVFGETIRHAQQEGLLVISDVKRGDVGSTAEAYARAHLEEFDADAVTLNPYLGGDSIAPFLDYADRGKGVFVLVKTSNPSSVEVQDLEAGDKKLYQRVAELVEQWGEPHRGRSGFSAVGAVVGATFPEAAAELRERMPHTIFLVPGYGAQGGGAEDCRACFDKRGYGTVVNSSRGIIFAYAKDKTPRWQDAVAEAARRMKDDLERVRRGKAT